MLGLSRLFGRFGVPVEPPAGSARRRRQWIEQALASINEALIAADAGGRVLLLNPIAEALTGWPQGKALGKPLVEVLQLADRGTLDPLESPVVRVVREGAAGGWASHTVLIDRGGRPIPVEYRAAPIPGDVGHVAGVVVLVRDVTEREQADEAMARLAAIVEASEDAITGISLDGLIMSWNAGARRIFGYAAVEVIGRPFAILLPPGRSGELADLMARVKRGERVDHFETEGLGKGGDPIVVSVAVSPIKEADGRIIGIASIARDISERKRAEAEAHRTELLRKLADSQEEERRRIARELHDEMGQHLAALTLGLESLKGPPFDRGRLRQLQDLTQQIGREVHRLALELRPTALDDLGLKPALVNYVEEWSERSGVEVDLHSAGLDHHRLPPQVETNLYRIVQEALTNIAKHAQAGHLSLILERRPDHLLTIIEDDGRGFDPEAATNGAGAGAVPRLGLLGMKERVAAVGGQIEVESAPGEGTTLYIRIPLAADGEAAGHE